jgi:Tfp pilus assembly protein FimT
VMGTAIPNLRAMGDPYAVDSTSQAIASDFSAARMRAIARNQRHRIVVNADQGWWEVQAETAPNAFTVVGGRKTLPRQMRFQNVSATPPVFDTRGMLAGNFSLDVSGTGRKRVVSVNVLGDTAVSHPQALSVGGVVGGAQG